MRITGGIYRGRILAAPPGRDVRPTSDKVRQALFNILAARGLPEGLAALDGFCGTGALGLEALSRGASSCVFLDSSRASLDICRRNIAALKLPAEQAVVLQRDLARPGERPAALPPADLVFLDPPYRRGLAAPALAALAAGGWLAEKATCVWESETSAPDDVPAGFTLMDQRDYGDTRLCFLARD